jgi:hypothetical protein
MPSLRGRALRNETTANSRFESRGSNSVYRYRSYGNVAAPGSTSALAILHKRSMGSANFRIADHRTPDSLARRSGEAAFIYT